MPYDTPLPDFAAAADWTADLAVGDIVAYRFPVAEDDGSATPKARPCLVLDIEIVGGRRHALLAYGTTASTTANRGDEVQVRTARAAQAAGLRRPTRFVGARRVMVPLDGAGFGCHAATGSPILGRLDAQSRKRMNAVRGRIHAERDIAAERRATGRSETPASRVPRFAVERRHPRPKLMREVSR